MESGNGAKATRSGAFLSPVATQWQSADAADAARTGLRKAPLRFGTGRPLARPLCLRAVVWEPLFAVREGDFETASQKGVIREEPFVGRHGKSVTRFQTQEHVRALYREEVRPFVSFRAVTAVRVPPTYVRASPTYVRVPPTYARHAPIYVRTPPTSVRRTPIYARNPAIYVRTPANHARESGRCKRPAPIVKRGWPTGKRCAAVEERKVVSGFSHRILTCGETG